jgi:hypothetical protein
LLSHFANLDREALVFWLTNFVRAGPSNYPPNGGDPWRVEEACEVTMDKRREASAQGMNAGGQVFACYQGSYRCDAQCLLDVFVWSNSSLRPR